MSRQSVLLLIASYADSIVGFRGDLIRAARDEGWEVVVAAPEITTDIRLAIEGLGATTRQIPLVRTGLNPLRDIQSLLSLCKLIKDVAPTTVLTYTIKPCIYGQIAARLMGSERRVALITGLGYAFTGTRKGLAGGLKWLLMQLYRLALSGSQQVVFQNADDRQLFVELGLVAYAKTEVVNGSGVNLQHFHQVALKPFPPVSFLFIGRMLADKGLRELVAAMSQLKRQFPACQLHLVGWFDDNPAGITETELRHWQDQQLVVFHGKQKDVRPFIESCHVFVLPSYREGMPRTVLEAMAMGRAIITTDAPGCRQTIEDGQSGFMVNVADVDELAEAMFRFCQNPNLIATMGAAARARAEAHFDVNKINQDMLKFIKGDVG